MLDDDLLRKYSEGFFGYGNPHGKYWFIGLEERGGRCEDEVQERLELWEQDFGGEPFIDGLSSTRSGNILDNPSTIDRRRGIGSSVSNLRRKGSVTR